jgi:hypothetical protein
MYALIGYVLAAIDLVVLRCVRYTIMQYIYEMYIWWPWSGHFSSPFPIAWRLDTESEIWSHMAKFNCYFLIYNSGSISSVGLPTRLYLILGSKTRSRLWDSLRPSLVHWWALWSHLLNSLADWVGFGAEHQMPIAGKRSLNFSDGRGIHSLQVILLPLIIYLSI